MDENSPEFLEYTELEKEIGRLSKHMTELRKRKKQLEDHILEEWDDEENPILKRKGTKYFKGERKQTRRKKESEKLEDILETLADHGATVPEDVGKAILESLKGESRHLPCIKKEVKKKK